MKSKPKPKRIKSTITSTNDIDNKHTFSSLYSPNPPPNNNNDSIKNDPFLFHMAKAIHPSILAVSEDDGSPSEDEDEFNDELSLMYHVPDGILSSPKTSNTNAKTNKDYHYNRILKPYPINYSATPSPKQSIVSPNGFGIDLQSLGYDISPPRNNNKINQIILNYQNN